MDALEARRLCETVGHMLPGTAQSCTACSLIFQEQLEIILCEFSQFLNVGNYLYFTTLCILRVPPLSEGKGPPVQDPWCVLRVMEK